MRTYKNIRKRYNKRRSVRRHRFQRGGVGDGKRRSVCKKVAIRKKVHTQYKAYGGMDPNFFEEHDKSSYTEKEYYFKNEIAVKYSDKRMGTPKAHKFSLTKDGELSYDINDRKVAVMNLGDMKKIYIKPEYIGTFNNFITTCITIIITNRQGEEKKFIIKYRCNPKNDKQPSEGFPSKWSASLYKLQKNLPFTTTWNYDYRGGPIAKDKIQKAYENWLENWLDTHT